MVAKPLKPCQAVARERTTTTKTKLEAPAHSLKEQAIPKPKFRQLLKAPSAEDEYKNRAGSDASQHSRWQLRTSRFQKKKRTKNTSPLKSSPLSVLLRLTMPSCLDTRSRIVSHDTIVSSGLSGAKKNGRVIS